MNLIVLFENDFVKGQKDVIRLRGRRFQYIKDIHRGREGDILNVGLLGGKLGTGEILSFGMSSLDMKVSLKNAPPPQEDLSLILALPRPNVINRVLIAATSIGVKRIVFFHCQRVEKSFWKSPVLKEKKIKESMILGLEQAKDTILPEVILKKRFKPFVEDQLPQMIKGTKAYVAHPQANKKCPSKGKSPVTLIVGPEGGFIPYEIEKLQNCGIVPISLGARILRVETAIPFLIAKLT